LKPIVVIVIAANGMEMRAREGLEGWKSEVLEDIRNP
jgi:hypothetical protein